MNHRTICIKGWDHSEVEKLFNLGHRVEFKRDTVESWTSRVMKPSWTKWGQYRSMLDPFVCSTKIEAHTEISEEYDKEQHFCFYRHARNAQWKSVVCAEFRENRDYCIVSKDTLERLITSLGDMEED